MIKKTAWILLGAALLLAPAAPARAIILSFDPVKQHASIGQQVDVDVRVSGLGNGAAPSLGAFDLDVTFNDLVLDFAGLTFGSGLDVLGFGFNPSGVAEDPDPTIGLVDFFEISLDASSDLDTFQADSFVLATLSFDAVAFGVSPLTFASAILSDSLGNALTATLSSGIIAVPEPGTLALFGIGLVGLALLRRRRA